MTIGAIERGTGPKAQALLLPQIDFFTQLFCQFA